MFGLPSLRLGRPFGIPLEIDPSWLFVFFLVAASLTTSYLPAALPDEGPLVYTALGLVTAIAFFASLILHELAHSLVARAGGLRVSRVTLFVFGGVSQLEEEPKSPGHEFAMAAAGPLTSLLLAGAFWGMRILAHNGGSPAWVLVPLEYLAVINASLAAFNMLPGFPLDGGRVLRAALWGLTKDMLKATKWASRSGQAIGTILMAVAVFGVLQGAFDFVWLAIMGWFMSGLAAAAYRQQVARARLAEIPLSKIMSSPVVLAPADISLEDMSHSYFLAGRHTHYPVVRDGQVIGFIDIERASEVPRERWPDTKVEEVAVKDLGEVVAPPGEPVINVLPRLEPGGPGVILVVEDGRLDGIVTRSDIIQFIMDMARDRLGSV